MAQEYNEILPGGSTNILQDNIDSRKNDEALRSGFSGSAFPTSPVPVAGQRCYREDLKKEYIFNGEDWVEVASSGAIAQEVTLARGTHTKLQDRLGVSMNPDGTLKTPATANVDEFKVSGFTPTYISTNSFSVPGDMRAIFTENRRLKITQGTETIYPAVVSSSYDDGTDKTTIVINGITITTEITAVDFSMVQMGWPANLDAGTLNGKSDTAFQEVAEKNQPGGYAGLDANGKIDSEWIKDASETVKGVVELATPAEVLAGEDTERAVTPAGFKAALASPAMTGSATLNGSTNNTVQLTDIVTTLGLEVGDVIRIQYSGYDKLHTVESITDDNSIIVNYEHAGNRGDGSLRLADETANVTITRIAKWYNAPLGLGQAWVKLTEFRVGNTNYANTTQRTITVFAKLGSTANQSATIIVDGVETSFSSFEASSGPAGATAPVNVGGIYKSFAVVGSQNVIKWSELR